MPENEGSTNVAAAPAPQEATQEAGAPQEAASTATETTEEPKRPDVAIKLDKETGKRTLVFGDDIETPKSEDAPQQEAGPAPYTADDLVKAAAMGQEIDPTRVPAELQGYVAAFQQQQINAQQQARLAQMQAAQQVQTPAPTPEQAEANKAQQAQEHAKAYAEMKRIAEEKAAHDLGITKEQLDDAQYSDDPELQAKAAAFDTAVRSNVAALQYTIAANRQAQAQRAAMVQQESQAALQAIAPKYAEYQKDPNFKAIDMMMGEYYKALPYQEAQQVVRAIQHFKNMTPTREDADVLDSYYKKTKEAFYAQKTGVGTTPQPVQHTKPPQVERSGQTGAPAPAQPTDWSQMRKMSPLDRSRFFREHFR